MAESTWIYFALAVIVMATGLMIRHLRRGD